MTKAVKSHPSTADMCLCFDCGVDILEINENYMVTNSRWTSAGMKTYGGMLCIQCLETRLGKKLTSVNFTDCPLNWRNICLPGHASTRLLSRMLGGQNSKWRKGALKLYKALAKGNKGPMESKLLLRLE